MRPGWHWLEMLCLLLWLSLLCCSYLSSPHDIRSCSGLERFGLNTICVGRKGDTQCGDELCTHGKGVCTHTTVTRIHIFKLHVEPAWEGLSVAASLAHWTSQRASTSILCLTGDSPLHLVSPLPHKKQPLPFCASQQAAPSILCLPSLTRNVPLHSVPPLPHKKCPPPFCAFPPP